MNHQLNSSTAQQLNSSTAQQLNSSTAQQLNSSTAQQLSRRGLYSWVAVLSCGLGSLTMIALGGCDALVAAKAGKRTLSESVGSTSSGGSQASWEAGLILAGWSGYQCLPLEAVGLKASDEVISVATSCDCISPSLVTYATSESSYASGILLQYLDKTSVVSDSAPIVTTPPPTNLGVLIDLTLADGRTHQFTVNLQRVHLLKQSNDYDVSQ
jgi:hypothetical protein